VAELRAPAGAFGYFELDDGLHPSRVAGIFHAVVLLPGVRCCVDLSLVSRELLDERVLLRLSPAEQRLWAKVARNKNHSHSQTQK